MSSTSRKQDGLPRNYPGAKFARKAIKHSLTLCHLGLNPRHTLRKKGQR